jgi:uncharacterized protein
MPPDVGCRAIDFLLESSGPRKRCEVDFFGGEPLLAFPTVSAVIKHARQREKDTGKKIKFTLTTNAMSLTPEIQDFLNSEDVQVILSLDGRPEVHNAMRRSVGGKETHEQIIENIKRFIKSRGPGDYYVRGTYTRQNRDFCSDAEFRGTCRTFGPGDYPNLPAGLNNQIPSGRRISNDYPYNTSPNWGGYTQQ